MSHEIDAGFVVKNLDIYADTGEIHGKSPGKNEWKDEEILGYTSLKLKILTNEEMNTECKIFLHGIMVESTPRSMMAALQLTWNMRSVEPVEARLFPRRDYGMDDSDLPVEEFEEEGAEYFDDTVTELIDGIKESDLRRACGFLAASTLKLFSKDTLSWVKAWESGHLTKRYMNFVRKEFPISGINPITECIERIYDCYQGHKVYIGTLGRILYCLAELKDQRQTEMLFDQHLSCTGLHIVPQFIAAKTSLGCKSAALLSALDMGQNRDTLTQLSVLIRTSLSRPQGSSNRSTWRFARLFEPNVFPMLQTKYAQDTVAILAHINKLSQSSSSTSNPLNIAVIRQMGPKRLRLAKSVAANIFHYFTVVSRGTDNHIHHFIYFL